MSEVGQLMQQINSLNSDTSIIYVAQKYLMTPDVDFQDRNCIEYQKTYFLSLNKASMKTTSYSESCVTRERLGELIQCLRMLMKSAKRSLMFVTISHGAIEQHISSEYVSLFVGLSVSDINTIYDVLGITIQFDTSEMIKK